MSKDDPVQSQTDTSQMPETERKGKRPRNLMTEAPWASYLEPQDRYGFAKLKNQPLRTMEERQYEEILIDDEKWKRLEERMEADFGHELEMFPFAERDEELFVNHDNWVEVLSWKTGNALKAAAQRLNRTRKMENFRLPRRYYAIARADIEERFPGGRASGDPGDGDIRDLLSAFRHLFRENLAMYIGKKRRYQFTAVALYCICVALLLLFQGSLTRMLEYSVDKAIEIFTSQMGSVSLSLVTPFLLGGLFIGLYKLFYNLFVRESEILFNVYNNAQTESCKTLDKQAALRTKNLAMLASTMAARIDKDQSQLMSSGQAQAWPERAYRWTLVVYWLGRRLENLERFTQMQIWLVRRTHYFYRLFASGSKHVINLICLAGIAILSGAVVLFVFDWGQKATGKTGLLQSAGDRYDAFVHWLKHLTGTGVMAPQPWAALLDDRELQWQTPSVWHDLPDYILGHASIWLLAVACVLGLVLCVRFLARVSDLSGSEWNTKLELVQHNLDVKNWTRYHSLNLHHILASQVRSDKGYLLQWETRMGGKFPGR